MHSVRPPSQACPIIDLHTPLFLRLEIEIECLSRPSGGSEVAQEACPFPVSDQCR